jgi:hypothetical protein
MKSKILLFVAILFSSYLMAQNSPPVAVNDTVEAKRGKTITIPVVNNDYDPDGDYFRVYTAIGSESYTDSTISYAIPYDYNLDENGYLQFSYVLIDETFNSGIESIGYIFISIDDIFYDYLDINNVNARINSFGNHFLNPYNDDEPIRYEFPKGSEINSVYSTSLWIGGISNGDTLVAGEGYHREGGDFWSGPLSVDNGTYIDTSTIENWRRVWKMNREEVLNHVDHWNDASYVVPDAIAQWPAHGDTSINQNFYLAPFVDTDNDGIYNPSLGDFPLVRGDQCIFFIFNDQKESKISGSTPIGLEIHGMAWAFVDEALPEDNSLNYNSLNNTIFLSYKVFNRSSTTLQDAYIGVFSDFDLGYAWDDFVGCDVEEGAFYGYNGDDYDEDDNGYPGYGDTIPAQAIVILGGPNIDPDNVDNPAGQCDESINGVGFGDGLVDNERYGMSSFIYFNNSGPGTGQGDPQYAYQYYNYMNAVWNDGTVMEYGGNGHVSSGAYGPECRFMFPGLSDSCNWGTNGIEPFGTKDWTETLAGNEPGDRRGLSAMGPFTFEANSVQKVDIAFVSAIDGTEPPLDLLKDYISEVKSFYFANPDDFGYEWLDVNDNVSPEAQEIKVYPNPASDIIYLELPDSDTQDFEYYIYDMYGKQISAGTINQNTRANIDISKLKKGFYILRLNSGNTINSARFVKTH